MNHQGEVHAILLTVGQSDVCYPLAPTVSLTHTQAILLLGVKRRDFSLVFLVLT